MAEIYHIPAMLKETIEGLAIKPGGVYVDVTFGGGGHSRAIMKGLEGGRLYSFDQDEDALQNAIENPQWTFVHSNFRYLKNWMDYYGVKEIDGLLADLGVSFHHFDCPERGFSFRFSAPLDMRMNQTAKRTAAEIVNSYSEEELARIFWLYGEMKNGRGIAKNICKARLQKPVLRTENLIEAALNLKTPPGLPSREETRDGMELEISAQYKKDLARLFQALRIEVNDEMGALREMLVAARDLLKPGGRIAILTYHSLEDRLVKNFFRSGNLEGDIEKDFYGNALTPFEVIEKGLTARPEEVERNPRSRSAKLRVAEKK
jgi:16S rRNA (cytosine1402-N4)-methyltransferase